MSDKILTDEEWLIECERIMYEEEWDTETIGEPRKLRELA